MGSVPPSLSIKKLRIKSIFFCTYKQYAIKITISNKPYTKSRHFTPLLPNSPTPLSEPDRSFTGTRKHCAILSPLLILIPSYLIGAVIMNKVFLLYSLRNFSYLNPYFLSHTSQLLNNYIWC
ncbi:hypothetical protein ACUXEY_000181 [Bacillus sp. F9_6S_D1_P_5]